MGAEGGYRGQGAEGGGYSDNVTRDYKQDGAGPYDVQPVNPAVILHDGAELRYDL